VKYTHVTYANMTIENIHIQQIKDKCLSVKMNQPH